MKIKKSRFKQIIQEELQLLKESAPAVNEELLDKVVSIAERDGDMFQAHRQGERDLESIAKEATLRLLEQIKEELVNEEQIAAVIETLAGQSSYSSNTKIAPHGGTNVSHMQGGGYSEE